MCTIAEQNTFPFWISEDLQDEYKRIHGLFEVDQDQLRWITMRFREELEAGLRDENSDIPMIPAWVTSLPTGTEKGQFLTIDLGGTNIRISLAVLHGSSGKYDLLQSEQRIPEDLKSSTGERLWRYITSFLRQFLDQRGISATDAKGIPLAFTFSYPVTQRSLQHGVLQRWTKGWDVREVEGRDVVRDLSAVLQQEGMPFSVKALVNDTVGTLMASAYVDGKTQIGSIYGTGNNAAYMERSDQVRKANGIALPGDSHMAINCEYGAFDNSAKVLPFTQYDIEIDRSSPRPGEQRYEKLVAGLYLGEIMRLILVDLHARDKVFRGQDGSRLRRPYALDSSVLANMETDRAGVSSRILLRETLGVTPDVSECKFCSAVARLVSRRSVRLYACGIAALVRKRGMKQPHVAVDGSVFAKYPGFPERAMEALREILGLPQGSDEPVRFVPAVDGSSVGAAVIAAMATKLERE